LDTAKPKMEMGVSPTKKNMAAKTLSIEESYEEMTEWPQEAKAWMNFQDNSRLTKWGSKKAHYFTFKENNYVTLYRGKTFVRIIPFIKKTDPEAKMDWAQC